MPNIRIIVCPVDFSNASDEAARYAVALAGKVGAPRVDLIHVFQRPVYVVPEMGYYVDASVEGSIRESLRRQLETLADRSAAEGVEIVTHLLEGVPYQAVVDHAEAVGADMIVMATHGRTGLTHFLLGSVAERVVRTSPVPVCTLRVEEGRRA